jgi:hypothetical protein
MDVWVRSAIIRASSGDVDRIGVPKRRSTLIARGARHRLADARLQRQRDLRRGTRGGDRVALRSLAPSCSSRASEGTIALSTISLSWPSRFHPPASHRLDATLAARLHDRGELATTNALRDRGPSSHAPKVRRRGCSLCSSMLASSMATLGPRRHSS